MLFTNCGKRVTWQEVCVIKHFSEPSHTNTQSCSNRSSPRLKQQNHIYEPSSVAASALCSGSWQQCSGRPQSTFDSIITETTWSHINNPYISSQRRGLWVMLRHRGGWKRNICQDRKSHPQVKTLCRQCPESSQHSQCSQCPQCSHCFQGPQCYQCPRCSALWYLRVLVEEGKEIKVCKTANRHLFF